jgi:hypothetical protein
MLLARRSTRCLTLLVAAALASPAVAAETVQLASQIKPGSVAHVEMLLEVGGDLKLTEKGDIKSLPMNVVAKMQYDERFATQAEKVKTALRRYTMAEAAIKLDKGAMKPALRADRRTIAVRCDDCRPTLVSLEGPLTGDELELVELPANSLLIDRLLPTEPVTQGQQWKHTDALIAGVLNLDAVSQTDVASTLKEIDATAARVEFSGTVVGAIDGISTTIGLKGRYKFDRQLGRITWLAMLIEEKRSIGHVAPGADVVARLQMTVSPAVGDLKELGDESLTHLDAAFAGANEMLEHSTGDKQFRFLYDRRWHVIDETNEAVALRLVDRGDLVAQCNVSHLQDVEPAKLPTLEQFQDDIRKSLDKNFGRFVHASEKRTTDGLLVYRTVIEGSASDLPILWNYYHVADSLGHHAVYAFTLEQNLTERLADMDEVMIATSTFLDADGTAALAPKRR